MLAHIIALLRGVHGYPTGVHIGLLVGLGIAWSLCSEIREYWIDLGTPSVIVSVLGWLVGCVFFRAILLVVIEAVWSQEYRNLLWRGILGISIVIFLTLLARVRASAVAMDLYEHRLHQRVQQKHDAVERRDAQE